MENVLVIDVGGTKTNVSIVSSLTQNVKDIKINSSKLFPTPSNPEYFIQKVLSLPDIGLINSEIISLSLPGKWSNEGILKESFYLHEWLNYPLIENFKKELKVKKCIWETDVICGALGEYYASGIEHDKSMLYINLGTGIGAAFIKDGKPFKSDFALTLRLQKLVFPYNEELYSGVDLISGGALLTVSEYDSVKVLFENYKKGEVGAMDIISKAQIQLASWIINLFYLFAPDLIVLNGGLTNDWEVLCEEAIELANEELENQVKIIQGKLKENAPIYGAFLNANNLF